MEHKLIFTLLSLFYFGLIIVVKLDAIVIADEGFNVAHVWIGETDPDITDDLEIESIISKGWQA